SPVFHVIPSRRTPASRQPKNRQTRERFRQPFPEHATRNTIKLSKNAREGELPMAGKLNHRRPKTQRSWFPPLVAVSSIRAGLIVSASSRQTSSPAQHANYRHTPAGMQIGHLHPTWVPMAALTLRPPLLPRRMPRLVFGDQLSRLDDLFRLHQFGGVIASRDARGKTVLRGQAEPAIGFGKVESQSAMLPVKQPHIELRLGHAVLSGLEKPFGRLVLVHLHPVPRLVATTQIHLRPAETLVRRLVKPLDRLRVILGHSAAVVIQLAQPRLRLRHPL